MVQSKFYLILSVLLFSASVSFAQWTNLNSGTTRELHDIFFIDKNTGFCVGGNNIGLPPGNGIILKTTDGGTNWNKVHEDSITGFNNIAYDGNTITVAGTDKNTQQIVMHSTNGGNNWIKDTLAYRINTPRYLNNKLLYINSMTEDLEVHNGVIGQTLIGRVIYFTTNNNNLYAICYSPTPGYNFMFAKSTDGGISWDSTLINFSTITTNSITSSSLWAFGDTIAYLATYPPAIAYSYDEGKTWTDTTVIFPTGDAFATSAHTITGVSTQNRIMKSTDGGITGTVQDSTTDIVTKLFFLDEENGFLCGRGGIIYKTTNGGGTSSITHSAPIHHHITIYPNPATTYVDIVSTVKLEDAKLDIYNMTGELVFNAEHLAGHSVRSDVSNLSKGVYTYTLHDANAILKAGQLIITGD